MGVLGAISHGAGVVATAALVLRAVVERLDRARRRNSPSPSPPGGAGRPSANSSLTATCAGGASSKDDVEGGPTRPLEPGASSPPANDASGASSPAFATPASSRSSPRAADSRAVSPGAPRPGRLSCVVAALGVLSLPTNLGGHATSSAALFPHFDEVWILPVFKHAYASAPPRALREKARDVRAPLSTLAAAAFNVRRDRRQKTVVEAAIAAQRFAVPAPVFVPGEWCRPVVKLWYDVLRWLRAAHPGMDFAWVMGGGRVRISATRRRRFGAVPEGLRVVVVPRSGTDAEEFSSGGALGARITRDWSCRTRIRR